MDSFSRKKPPFGPFAVTVTLSFRLPTIAARKFVAGSGIMRSSNASAFLTAAFDSPSDEPRSESSHDEPGA